MFQKTHVIQSSKKPTNFGLLEEIKPPRLKNTNNNSNPEENNSMLYRKSVQKQVLGETVHS